MNGSQYFGRSGGSLASIASSGKNAAIGGPSCGSAGGCVSPYVCGKTGQALPSVNSQPYTPTYLDIYPPLACPAPHG